MTKKSNEFSPKLKYYHIILIAMIISPFLVLNSNSINKKKEQRKIFRQNEIFMRKLYGRNLGFKEDTKEICDKGTEDLRKYYETGDPETIGLKEGAIEKEDEGEYITALVNLISSEGDSGDNIMNYAMHLIPVLIFLVITIFFLPGWLICCICSCCNCCCCCCCKKPKCKLPFYIVTCVIYALGIAISIYGLSVSNSVFVGLADTECSILKFVGEVLDGETRQEKPRWGGISKIKDIFSQTKNNINSLTESKKEELERNKDNSKNAKNDFEDGLKDYSLHIYDDDPYDTSATGQNYKKTFPGHDGDYYLDIAVNFGKFSKDSDGVVHTTSNSFVDNWYTEYKIISQNSETQMESAYKNFDELIQQKGTATEALDDGISSINDIQSSFDSIKDSISEGIIDYSEIIEYYGKLGFKVIFSVLMVIDAAIAAFISLRIFTQFLVCNNPCLKCFLKSVIHILWNILALITFFALLFGFIFTLLGTIGKDLISVVSVLFSDDNLNKGENAPLIGGASVYLKTCINGDGKLEKALDLDISAMGNIESLKNASNDLKSIKNETEVQLGQKIAYNAYKAEYDKRKNYEITNFNLMKKDKSNPLNLDYYLENFNTEIRSQKGEWLKTCDAGKFQSCHSNPTGDTEYCIQFPSCEDGDLSYWNTAYSSSSSKGIVFAFIESINLAKSETNPKSIAKALTELNSLYTTFLGRQTDGLKTFIETIDGLTGIFNDLVGEEGGIFSMLNCLFIGRNVKVILKYLKASLGTNIYTVGVCLLTTGIAMCVSIAFTILLNIIINTADNTNVGGDGVPEIGNNGQDPNVNFNNSPQGNYETEKVAYGGNYNQNNYNNNENYTGGVRIINYN